MASYAHMYVPIADEVIVGTGSISSFWGSIDESILLAIFVVPELQCYGIGGQIMATLEEDEFYTRARRIEIPSSITAKNFYVKFGDEFKDGAGKSDEEGHYRLEKLRQIQGAEKGNI